MEAGFRYVCLTLGWRTPRQVFLGYCPWNLGKKPQPRNPVAVEVIRETGPPLSVMLNPAFPMQ